MIGDSNHQDSVHRPSLARDFAAIDTRLAELERRTVTPVVTLNALGQAWTTANGNYLSPNNVLAWTELRLTGTDDGAQLWRAVPTAGGNNEWRRVA